MKTVLIVDDVQTDRELMGRVVNSCGYKAEYATDGTDALPTAKAVKPSLILLDVVMPKMDGYAACRQLKADNETSAIPVVLVTSKSAESDRFWGKRQGANDQLGKPFTPEKLAEVVKKYAG
jgi:twitching motility two-component system response regulator PilH